MIHDVYSYIKKCLDEPFDENKKIADVFTYDKINREVYIQIIAQFLQQKNNQEYFRYALLPGNPIELKESIHLLTKNLILPNLGTIKGIIFSDKIPDVIFIRYLRPFDGIFKTTTYNVFKDQISDYTSNGKTYRIWAEDNFSLNSTGKDGFKFLSFDKEIEPNTIGFVLELQHE
jgi:hypothetical protein